MAELFVDLPEAIENTVEIAKRCAVMSETAAPLLPSFSTTGDNDESEELKLVSEQGLEQRLEDHVYTADMDDAKKAEVKKEYFDRCG